jgi:hypothetical protein
MDRFLVAWSHLNTSKVKIKFEQATKAHTSGVQLLRGHFRGKGVLENMAEPSKVSSLSNPFDALPEDLLHSILGKCATDMHRAGTEIHPENSILASCRLVSFKWAEEGAKQLTTVVLHPFRDLEEESIRSLTELLETKGKQITKLKARLANLRYWAERESKKTTAMRKV